MNKTRNKATLLAALTALALAGASGSALAGHDNWKGHKHHKYDKHHSCANPAYPRSSRSYYYVEPQVRYYYDSYAPIRYYAPTRYYDGGGRGDIVLQYRYRY